MYKVFVNDKPLFLTNQIFKETDFQLFLLESVDFKQLIVKYFQNKIQKAYLYHPDEKEIFKVLKTKIPVNKAGGFPDIVVAALQRNGLQDDARIRLFQDADRDAFGIGRVDANGALAARKGNTHAVGVHAGLKQVPRHYFQILL